MRDKVLEIFKGWGFESNGVYAEKKCAGGKFIYDPISQIEKGELVLYFYSDTAEVPSRRAQTSQIIKESWLEELPSDKAVATYLQMRCRSMIESVISKILFNIPDPTFHD